MAHLLGRLASAVTRPARAGAGAPYTRGMQGRTDYRMAKRALVREVTHGVVPRADVCDAHPELLRAARSVGAAVERACPICALADERAAVPADATPSMRLVTYVFGDDLRRSEGKIVWSEAELAELAERYRSLQAYTVECCLVCGWNHLMESYPVGRADAG